MVSVTKTIGGCIEQTYFVDERSEAPEYRFSSPFTRFRLGEQILQVEILIQVSEDWN